MLNIYKGKEYLKFYSDLFNLFDKIVFSIEVPVCKLCNIAITMFPEGSCRRFVHVNHCMIKFLRDSTRKRCD